MTLDGSFEKRNLSDHAFAKVLQDAGAIANYEHSGPYVFWRNSKGVVVAVAKFDNVKCTRKTWIRVDS
jgi:hypothetical protein